MSELWYPGAVRRPPVGAAALKHGGYSSPEPHRKEGIVAHSMEGSLAAALGELDKVARRASWTFSNPKVGQVLQHFDLGCDTWASGSAEANMRFTSCESEGKEGEPLNENQIENFVGLCRWLAVVQQWPQTRRLHELIEHKEAVAVYGGGATACPSSRYPWGEILRRLSEPPDLEDDMAPATWVRDDKTGDSFVISGRKKVPVNGAAQEAALLKAKYIVHPAISMTTAELATIPDA